MVPGVGRQGDTPGQLRVQCVPVDIDAAGPQACRCDGKGLEILGFPCNQFGAQEPGTEKEIAEFCELNFGVTFPMFAKVDVNGEKASPLYRHLKSAKKGLLGSEAIKWNFTKFLVDREGNVVERYAPKTEPKDLEDDVKKLL